MAQAKVTVLGSGNVGRVIAEGFLLLDYDVAIGTRSVDRTLARPEFLQWHQDHSAVQVAGFVDALHGADLLVNALSGSASVSTMHEIGVADLGNRTLIDISNPLDFSNGYPPTLFISNTDSLGEQIQREFPNLRVVKTLNTVNSSWMIPSQREKQVDFTVFLSGNDQQAKDQVSEILTRWGHRDVLDLGDITTCRGSEMSLLLWMQMSTSLGTWESNFKIVR